MDFRQAQYPDGAAPARNVSRRYCFVNWPTAVLVAATFHGMCAVAQTTESNPDAGALAAWEAMQLPPVEVVATPSSIPLIVVSDPKSPRQPLPASDGSDYLKTIPGFTSIRSGGTNSEPVLRGMFGSRLAILANGVPSLGACPHRMDSPTSYIAPESYDKVMVVKGPESVLYGPGASAGTVLFERETPRFTQPGVRFDGSVVAGSFGRNDQNADLTAGSELVYGRVIASHSHQQDYEDGNDNSVPSQWDKWNADAILGVTPNDRTRIELSAGTGDGYARFAGRDMDGVHFRRQTFALKFDERDISRTVERIEAQIYYNNVDHVMDNSTLRSPDMASDMPMAMASDVRRRTLGARAAVTLRITDDLELITGADGQANQLASRMAMGDESYAGEAWNPQASMSDAGWFSQLTWYMTQRARLVAGGRVDYSTARDRRATSDDMMGMSNPTSGDLRTSLLPSGFVRFERDLAALPVSWYAGLGHVERFPDYWELFSTNSYGADGSENAFTSVRPEKTTQADLGIQYKSRTLDLWASGYVGYVQDFILFDYSVMTMEQSAVVENVNAQIMGGEVGASWRPRPNWRFDSSVAYAWGRNASTGSPLPQIPPLETRFGVEYSRAAWTIGGLWRVVPAQHRYAIDQGNVVGKDFGLSAGFGVLSLNAQYRFSKSVQLTLGIDNVLNKAYAEHLNLAGSAGFGYSANEPVMEPGRAAWLRMSVKL